MCCADYIIVKVEEINIKDAMKPDETLKQQLTECHTLSPNLYSGAVAGLAEMNSEICAKYHIYCTKKTGFEMLIVNEELKNLQNNGQSKDSLIPHHLGSILEVTQQFKKEIEAFQKSRISFVKNCITGFHFFKDKWIKAFNAKEDLCESKILRKDRPDFEVVFEAFKCDISEFNPDLEKKATSIGTYITLRCQTKK